MRILFIDSNHPILHETLQQAGFLCDLNYHWSEDEILNNIHQYDGIVLRSKISIGEKFLDKATRLKFIARAGAGMEHIAVDKAEKKGVTCISSPEGNKDAVAEHAIGMLLSLLNNICKANSEIRQNRWLRELNRGLEIMGKTIGIIGYGNIGTAFSKRLSGFGVQVIAYDKYKSGFSNDIVKEVDFKTLLTSSDIISVHVPLTDETHYMINDSFIDKVAKPFYLINTARGKVVETTALIKGLKSGKVKGACLDVLEYETVSFEKIESENEMILKNLLQFNNVLLTPHIAGWSVQSNEKIAKVLAEKIIKQFAKQ